MYLKETFLIFTTIFILCLAETESILEEMNGTTDSSSEEIGEEPLDSSSTRGIIGDIVKIKKVVDVIETVGQKVIPAFLDGQKSGNDGSDKPVRFKLLKALKSDNKDDKAAPPE